MRTPRMWCAPSPAHWMPTSCDCPSVPWGKGTHQEHLDRKAVPEFSQDTLELL